MNVLFRAYFRQKIPEETLPNIYLGQDPDPESDPDVFKSRFWIRSKIVRICNTVTQDVIAEREKLLQIFELQTISHRISYTF
jgi:hypothetical protein